MYVVRHYAVGVDRDGLRERFAGEGGQETNLRGLDRGRFFLRCSRQKVRKNQAGADVAVSREADVFVVAHV